MALTGQLGQASLTMLVDFYRWFERISNFGIYTKPFGKQMEEELNEPQKLQSCRLRNYKPYKQLFTW